MVKRSEAGFTMIEVMVAMLLTAIAIIGILALFMAQTRASGFSRHMTEATALCEDKLEKLRTLTTASAGLNGTESSVNERGITGSGIYSRTWSYTPQANYADIVCTMTWNEEGDAKTLTLRARRGL